MAAARKADAAILFLGLSPDIEGEEMPVHVNGFDGGDRTAIELPDAQRHLANAVAATGKPVVLVLMSGSAIALGDVECQVSAILEAWYPGEEGGNAIAETLWGQNNPSGRLPITFYASTAQLPPFEDYAMQGRTYRYFAGEPLYPFGFGLSYTTFRLREVRLSSEVLRAGDALDVTAQVANTGTRDGSDVVEAYLTPHGLDGVPLRALVGFENVPVQAGESREVRLHIAPRQLSYVDDKGNRSIQPGKYSLFVGGGQPGSGDGLTLDFDIVGAQALAP